MKIRRADDVSALNARCFPGDIVEPADAHWILWDEDRPVGFVSMARLWTGENGAFLSRVGVVPGVRGSRLGRRLIRVGLAWARREGMAFCVTYCLTSNWPSIVNLLACGFEFYEPAYAWVGTEKVHYFYRAL